MNNITTLFDIFLNTISNYEDKEAFIYKKNNIEYRVTYKELFNDVLVLSRAFTQKGVKKSDKVMFISDNRYEWIVTDLALISLGAISVPRGTDTPTQELEYIMTHSNCKFLVIENPQSYLQHKDMLDTLSLSSVFIIDNFEQENSDETICTYEELTKDRYISDADIENFKNLKDIHDAKDVFAIIYTSGTTGKPKGVQLNHINMKYNIDTVPNIINLKSEDSWLSILPSWHVYERGVEYIAMSRGSKIIYSNIKTFGADLQIYKPTIVATVPRIWESMYFKINNTLSKTPTKAYIFNKLVEISKAYKYNKRVIKNQLPRYEIQDCSKQFVKKIVPFFKVILLYPLYLIAMKKLSAVQDKFGGRLKLAISGGGALPEYIDEWIDALGIRIVNSYGMTECSPSIAGRALNCDIFGTTGPALDGTKIRVVDESGDALKAGEVGEVQVKGPQVMSGYYNNDEENRKTFTCDGYLKTGDLGKLTITGELVITGRIKEIIVLANGENVDPSRIESAVSSLPFINDLMLVGQDKKGLGLLIVADFEILKEYVSKKLNKAIDSVEHAMEDKYIVNNIKSELNELLNTKYGFKPFEKLQNIHFLEKEFKVGEELTNTLKKKRHIIEKKYQALIDKFIK